MTITAPPVELIFCKTTAPLSRVIMWGLDEPASHLAIDLPACRKVIHSDLLGLHKMARADFLAAHTCVATFKIYLDENAQRAVEKKLVDFVDDQQAASYDYGAFAYFSWRALLSKLGGPDLPRTNPWGSTGEYLCTEGAYLLNQAIVEATGQNLFTYDTELDAMSPWQLRTLLVRSHGGTNEVHFRRPAAVVSMPPGV